MKKLLLILPVVVLLTACPQAQPQPNPLTAEDARNLKVALQYGANALAQSIRNGGSSAVGATTFGLRPQSVTGTCGPNTPAPDADGDKIPANFSYIYDCTVTFSPSLKFVAKGSLRVTDANDQDPNSGFSTDGSIRYDLVFTNTETSQSSSLSVLAQWTASAVLAANGGYTISTDQRLTVQPDTDKSQFAYQLNVSYTPDNDGNALKFDAGTINLTGSANFRDAKGRFSIFNLSANNLHFGNTCPRAIDSGSIRIEDLSNIVANKNNVLLLTATACDIWSATYNGSIVF